MIHLKFGRKPQGKLSINIKVTSLLEQPERLFEKFIERRIIPLREKYPYADIHIEVQD
jgi:hypothetical protein